MYVKLIFYKITTYYISQFCIKNRHKGVHFLIISG